MKLPLITGSPEIPAQTALPRVSPEDVALPYRTAAAALLRTSDTLADWAEKDQRLKDTEDVTERLSQSSREMDEFRTTLDSDADYGTHAERFAQKAQEIHARNREGLSPRAAAEYSNRWQPIATTAEMGVRGEARKRRVEESVVKLQASVDDVTTRMGAARTEEEREVLKGEAQKIIDDALAVGLITPAQARRFGRDTFSNMQTSQVMTLIRQDPWGTLEALQDPKNFKDLTSEAREKLKAEAFRIGDGNSKQEKAEINSQARIMLQTMHEGNRPFEAEAQIAQIKAVNPILGRHVERQYRVFERVDEFSKLDRAQQAEVLLGMQQKAKADKGMSPEDSTFYDRANRAYRKYAGEMISDPWTAVLNRKEEIRDLAMQGLTDPTKAVAAREASVAEQRREGVSLARVQVASNDQVKTYVKELQGLADRPADLVQRLTDLRKEYGYHWEILARQIGTEDEIEKKVPGLATILEQPHTVEGIATAANIARAAKVSSSEMETVHGPDKMKIIRDRVRDDMGPFFASNRAMPSGMEVNSRYAQIAERLATVLMGDNKSLTAAEAAEMAVKQLTQHYTFVSNRQQTVRIPKVTEINGLTVPVDPRVVVNNMDAVRERLGGLALVVPPSDVEGRSPEQGKAIFVERMQKEAKWVPARGGIGLVLAYEVYNRVQPVLYYDERGLPREVLITFGQNPLPAPTPDPMPTLAPDAIPLGAP